MNGRRSITITLWGSYLWFMHMKGTSRLWMSGSYRRCINYMETPWVSAGEPHPVSQEESLLALNPVALSGRSAVGLKLLQLSEVSGGFPSNGPVFQKIATKALEHDGSEMRGMMAYGDFWNRAIPLDQMAALAVEEYTLRKSNNHLQLETVQSTLKCGNKKDCKSQIGGWICRFYSLSILSIFLFSSCAAWR